MKFKNVSDKVINLFLNGNWEFVQPGQIIELPHYIGDRQVGLERVGFVEKPVIEEPAEEPEVIEVNLDVNLNKMTKDQLNDHGARIGLEEINTSMKRADMIDAIIKFNSEKNE